MNSENNKTSNPHRLLLNLTDKMNLKRNSEFVDLLNLSIYYTCMKNHTQTNNLCQHGMINLNYWVNHILYQILTDK